MYQITIGDIAGITGCVLFVVIMIVVHNLCVKVMRPDAEENKEDYLAHFMVWVLRVAIIVFSLVPFAFFGFVYLSNHPHALDFLIFK